MPEERVLSIPLSLVRAGLVVAGLGAVAWSLVVTPVFWSESVVHNMAVRILSGEQYKSDILGGIELRLREQEGAGLRAATASKAAVLRLRRAELSIAAADASKIDADLQRLSVSVDRALMGVPSDAFLWLVRFWCENNRIGFKPENLRDLRLSYSSGPQEGWVAIRRNRVALNLFPLLPPDLAEASVTEFVDLIRARFYPDAVRLLTGPGWPHRNLLAARLTSLTEPERREFAKALADRGVDGFSVPGIEARPPRPWR